MKMKDYILDEIVRGLYLKTVLELDDSMEQKISKIAVEILETKDQKMKEILTKEYEQLRASKSNGYKKFDELEVEDVTSLFTRNLDKKIREFLK